MYTSHGHHILGTIKEAPRPAGRCGGVGICATCTSEAHYVHTAETHPYQRKTVKADAVQFQGTKASAIHIIDWVRTAGSEIDWNPVRKILIIDSPQNSATAEVNDWVLLEEGNFYVKPDEEFHREYEKATFSTDD